MRLPAAVLSALLLSASTIHAQAPVAPTSAETFLAENLKKKGMKALPSGLQYEVVKAGKAGPSPKAGDYVKVHYEGALTNGSVFDSSIQRGKPAIMSLEDLIPGWMEALPLMKVGDEWLIYTPPSLGYGERGAGPIPPNSALVFRIHLLGMLTAD